MFRRTVLAAAAVAALGLQAAAARADFFDFLLHPGRIFDGGQSSNPTLYDANGRPSRKFNDSYYTPSAKHTAAKPKSARTPTVDTGSAKPDQAAPAASGGPAAGAAGGPVSCDKAAGVVSGYGFTDVRPASCAGQVYAFRAVRDGKPYAIEVSPATGELVGVHKVQ